MAVDAKHPLYEERMPDWEQMTDTYGGERSVKAKRDEYLPITAAMEEDGMGDSEPGKAAYDAYIQRAVYPDDVRAAVEGLVGIMHLNPAVIEVPAGMEDILLQATVDGSDAWTLLRRINEAQLVYGRIGLLVDIPSDVTGVALPYVSLYTTQSIINWSTGTNQLSGRDYADLIVLDESGMVQQSDLSWSEENSWRVLTTVEALTRLGIELKDQPDLDAEVPEGQEPPVIKAPTSGYVYSSGPELDLNARSWLPVTQQGKEMDRVPFVFCNVQDTAPEPDIPPLLGLSFICLGIYRGEADYRHALFMQGQETLVIIEPDPLTNGELDEDEEGGGDTGTRVGAGAILRIPAVAGADAKYIGVSAAGLAEMKAALDADYERAANAGMKLLDTADGSSQQSGDALRIRVAARTASLAGVAKAGAAALEQALRHAATMMGKNPDEVTVKPNLDFASVVMSGEDLSKIVASKTLGAPLSWRSIHALMARGKLTSMTFEEEQEEIETEEPVGGTDEDGNPLGAPDGETPPADDEEEETPPDDEEE